MPHKRRQKPAAAGFTLIELLVGIGIIGLISGLFMANFRAADKRTGDNYAAQAVVSLIREAQNSALGLEHYQGGFPAGGWGVYFNSSQPDRYVLFADVNSNSAYDAGSENERTVFLPAGMAFSLSEASPVAVIFMPPDPKTVIKANGADATNVDIILTGSRVISINQLGLISLSL